MNCRFGDLNVTLGEEALLYEMNVDLISNKHGLTYGKNMCKIGGIFPLNHLVYKNKAFKGGFTYFKANKSQLDYIYSNKEGLKFIKNVMLHENNWHLSDHIPISIEIISTKIVNCSFVLKHAKEVNLEFNPHQVPIVRNKSTYDFNSLVLTCQVTKRPFNQMYYGNWKKTTLIMPY